MASDSENLNQPKLLLEREVAPLLRCSVGSVKRLRLENILGYYRGRPVLVSEDQVRELVESCRAVHSQQRKRRKHPRRRIETKLPASASWRVLLTQSEAADYCHCSPKTVRYWRINDKIPYVSFGRALFSKSDLDEFLEARRRAAARKTPGTPEFVAQCEAEVAAAFRLRILRKDFTRRWRQRLRQNQPSE